MEDVIKTPEITSRLLVICANGDEESCGFLQTQNSVQQIWGLLLSWTKA